MSKRKRKGELLGHIDIRTGVLHNADDGLSVKYAQLIELEWLVIANGHGRFANDPAACELCASLVALRKHVCKHHRLAVCIMVARKTRGLLRTSWRHA